MKTDDYASQSLTDTLTALEMDGEHGLDEREVEARQARFGYNEIEEKEEPLWHRVFRRFWGPIPWMIESAAILSALVQKWENFVIIALMLLVNSGLDFFQEHWALNALKALKQRLTAEIIVLRGGVFTTLPSALMFMMRGLPAGIVDHIAKPIDPEMLVATFCGRLGQCCCFILST